MASEREISDSLVDLQSKLRDLTPAPTRLNTARTMYLAGQQSVLLHRRWQACWPLSTAVLAVACITLAVLLASPDEPRVVFVPAEANEGKGTVAEPDRPHADSVADPEQVAPSSDVPPGGTRFADRQWDEFLDEILNDRAVPNPADLSSGKPVIMETVSCSDWPSLLTGQSEGEHFRWRVEPLRHGPSVTLQYLTTLFPSKGS
jgi:hypothetical protein